MTLAFRPSGKITRTLSRKITEEGSAPFFTDELTDGAGTPVAITNLKSRQVFGRGGTVTLSGTYSVNGGTPSSMAARFDGGAWVELTAQTIGGGTWSGSYAVPATLGQGTLEVKPRNGENVTPGEVANVTVTYAVAICGQSGASGAGTSAQSYTKTTFDCVAFDDGTYSLVTTTDWPAASSGSPWPHMATSLDGLGVPPALIRGHTQGSTGFANDAWDDGGAAYNAAVADLNDAGVGRYHAIAWDLGQYDAKNLTGTAAEKTAAYKAAFLAMKTALTGDVPALAGAAWVLGQIGELDTADASDPIRQAVTELVAENADIHFGASYYHLDLTDDIHATTNDQLTEIGQAYARSIAAVLLSGADPAGGPEVVSMAVGDGSPLGRNVVEVVFDRALANHSDTTGWSVSDDNGAATISSGAAATTTVTNDTVRLTCSANLLGDVTVSFGSEDTAVGATLADTGTPAMPPAFTLDYDAGTGIGSAPTDIALSATEVQDDATPGDNIAVITGTDADSDISSFSIVTDPDEKFAVVDDAGTWRLRVRAGASFDAGTASSHDVTLRATDAAGNTYDEAFEITVTAAVTTYVHDTFTDTDSTGLPSHTPDVDVGTGGWANEAVSNSNVVIVSNEARAGDTSATGGARHIALIDSTVADGTLTATVRADDATVGILCGPVFRAVDANSCWMVVLGGGGQTAYLWKRNSSGANLPGAASASWTPTGSGPWVIRVELSGNDIAVFEDDVEVASVTDAFNATETHIGVRFFNDTSDLGITEIKMVA